LITNLAPKQTGVGLNIPLRTSMEVGELFDGRFLKFFDPIYYLTEIAIGLLNPKILLIHYLRAQMP